MAWALVQGLGTNSASSSATVVITTAVTHTAGNKIFVWIAWGLVTRSVSGVTDSAGNTYSPVDTQAFQTGKNGSLYVSTGSTALASGGTITVTLSGSSTSGVMACAGEFSGGSTTIDGNVHTTGLSTTDPSLSGLGLSLSASNELCVANIVTISAAPGDYSSSPAGWSNLYDFKCTGQNMCIRADYAIGLSAGARSDAWSGTLKNSWTLNVGALAIASAAAPGGQMPCFGAQ